jgi:hypothetical protein
MTFKDLTYKQKNKFLLIGAGILLLLSWLFSFSKAWSAYSQNKRLVAQSTSSAISNQVTYSTQQKFSAVDSLVKAFVKDSVEFENNFLTGISQSLQGLHVELSYQDIPQQSSENSKAKTIRLQGGYKSIIQAIARLEKEYFIGRVRFEKESVWVEVM